MRLTATDIGTYARPEWDTPSRSIRVAVVQPPATGEVQLFLSHMQDEGDDFGHKPPIGILYIATCIKERTPHEVIVIDAQAEGLDLRGVVRRIADFGAHVVGISAWTAWWYSAHRLGQMIKEEMPDVHLCYGGPHLGIFPEETLAAPHTDSVIVGDGEVPFTCLCNMVASGIADNSLPGLHFKEHGVKPDEERFFIHSNLNDLPIPDRTLLPLKNYASILGKSDYTTTMITSRGCPNKCTCCKLNFQKTLKRSADSVVREFEAIQALGISEVEIYDDTFTWSKERIHEICRGLIEKNITVKWAIRDRVNNVREDLLDAMKAAGCTRIHYGIESGVNRVLKLMKKNITTEQAERAVRLTKAKGFIVLTYFMLGNKGESVDDIRRTIDFALRLDAHYTQFSITIPYPGTELYDDAISRGVISHDYWSDFAREPVPDFSPPELAAEDISIQQLKALRDEAVKRYYFRPKFILNEIGKLRNWSEFQRKFKMGSMLLAGLLKKK